MLCGVTWRHMIFARGGQGVDEAANPKRTTIPSGSQRLFDLCEVVRIVIGDPVELGF